MRLATIAAALTFLAGAAQAQFSADGNADGVIDITDYGAFHDCMAGPGTNPSVGCWMFDTDLDVDLDMADFAAFQVQFGSLAPAPAKVMGIWSGSGQAPDGSTHPFTLTLAQWDHKIWGLGELTVDPGDFLNGIPAVHVDGAIYGNEIVASMSAEATNGCFLKTPDAYIVRLVYEPATQTIELVDLVTYLPVACDQAVESFSVTRSDSAYTPGNAGIAGTWTGQMVTPAGWFYSPIPFWHRKKSFVDSGGQVQGYIQPCPGCAWLPLNLDWNPATGEAFYQWICSGSYGYKGVVDGNKFSGIFKWSSGGMGPDADFHGVFCYTLRAFEPPTPLNPGC
jgi:hypothetical protein